MTSDHGDPSSEGVARRTPRLGYLASSVLVALVALAVGALALVTCRVTPPPGPELLDAGVADAAIAPDAARAPDVGALDADLPALGNPCASTQDCAPPATICCVDVCLAPRFCM